MSDGPLAALGEGIDSIEGFDALDDEVGDAPVPLLAPPPARFAGAFVPHTLQ